MNTSGRFRQLSRKPLNNGSRVASVAVASPRGLAWTWDHQHLIVGSNNELVFLNPQDLTVDAQIGNLGVGQIF